MGAQHRALLRVEEGGSRGGPGCGALAVEAFGNCGKGFAVCRLSPVFSLLPSALVMRV